MPKEKNMCKQRGSFFFGRKINSHLLGVKHLKWLIAIRNRLCVHERYFLRAFSNSAC